LCPLIGVRQAREGHHSARREFGGLMDQPVDMRVIPNLLRMSLYRRGVVEAFDRCDLAPEHAVEVWADRAWRALLESMACLADSGVTLTLGGIGFGDERGNFEIGIGSWLCCLAGRRGSRRRCDDFWQRR